MSDIKHRFGNIDLWTKDKLDRLAKYLSAYTTALKRTKFRIAYIDAFAGTGVVNTERMPTAQSSLLFEDIAQELKEFIDGSAKIALQTTPRFHKYIFIEKNKGHTQELEKLKEAFPELSDDIQIVNAEANDFVQDLCGKDWLRHDRRAVMFLDPYGMQVSWKTIEAIARTKAIDLWLLFPIGAVNRLLNRNGIINRGRRKRLDTLFGTEDWFREFFQEEERFNLITGNYEKYFIKKAPFEIIAQYFNDKLKSVFSEVAPNPLFLNNQTNSPIFLLCFAAGNPSGAPIAVKIAQNILKQK